MGCLELSITANGEHPNYAINRRCITYIFIHSLSQSADTAYEGGEKEGDPSRHSMQYMIGVAAIYIPALSGESYFTSVKWHTASCICMAFESDTHRD